MSLRSCVFHGGTGQAWRREDLHLATHTDGVMPSKCNFGLVVDLDGLRTRSGQHSRCVGPASAVRSGFSSSTLLDAQGDRAEHTWPTILSAKPA